eukprot:TRINITY_DN77783_c0_g1_i1.p1 TRINITY_DN77783_c0_g1~~TRINITY_DN77783_c0_g1_i1.p1  ORF type:complete len:239 (+),score=42.98 TRINITY_DN77783_c0_g1_i1:54-770(+)
MVKSARSQGSAQGRRRLLASAAKRKSAKNGLTRKELASLVLQRPATGPSTKSVSADLAKLKRYLGHACPHFGKKGVIQLFAPKKLTSKTGDASSAPPRFNKYAGWAEWRNAIFLWVNAVGGNFTNTFKQKGQQLSWYVGGQNPTTESPIVKRLLRKAHGEGSEKDTKVLLFIRPRETEPYIVCGPCTYAGHNAKKKGFEFTWQLQEFGALQKCSDFKRLIDATKPASSRTSSSAAKWA